LATTVAVWVVLGLGFALVLHLPLRGYARRVEAGADPPGVKRHRLRRAWLLMYPIGAAAAVVWAAVTTLTYDRAAGGGDRDLGGGRDGLLGAAGSGPALAAALSAAGLGLVLLATYLAVRPALLRLRPDLGPAGRPPTGASLLVIAANAPTSAVGWFLAPSHGLWPAVGAIGGYVVLLVGLNAAALPVLVARSSTSLPEPRRAELLALAARMKVRIGDVRVVPGRQDRIVTTGAVGLIPRWTYLVVSDHLLDELEPAELDAALAHQLGHVRAPVYALLAPTLLGLWALGILAVGPLAPNLWVLAWVTFVCWILAQFVVGRLGLSVGEVQADRRAARVVGAAVLATAVKRQDQAGGWYPRTHSVWLHLPPHGDPAGRLARLRTERITAAAPR
jgi:Zn-dependent protease with chaperone function